MFISKLSWYSTKSFTDTYDLYLNCYEIFLMFPVVEVGLNERSFVLILVTS
jgi:hypothetical protein